MIHQCYFDESQKARLFTNPVYRGFGVYSSVNPELTRNCPELENPKNQPMLSEYAAMLHIWRNPDVDPDPWIGFTSYRQLDKSATIIENREDIEQTLSQCDIIGWGPYAMFDATGKMPVTLAEQSEWTHQGLLMCLWKLLMMRGETLPPQFLTQNVGLFCNYWVMSKTNFQQYMEWSYPLVKYCLDHPDDYVQSHPRSMAYLVERLFIVWYLMLEKSVTITGQPTPVLCRNTHYNPEAFLQNAERERFICLPSWHMSLYELCLRHRVKPKGIIHIGAHYAEEREVYKRTGAENVLWIEADPAHMSQLTTNLESYPGNKAIQACLTDVDGQKTSFYRTTNNGESSSVLPMGLHQDLFQNIHVSGETTLTTKTFQKLVEEEDINVEDYDLLVVDVQGAELLALRGFGELLHKFDAIWIEVNLKELYQGCVLLPELDEFLAGHGFSRRETLITRQEYGDGFYLRDGKYPPNTEIEQQAAKARRDVELARNFHYHVVGQGWKRIELLSDGRVGEGSSEHETAWHVRASGQEIVLELVGPVGRTGCFHRIHDTLWKGGSLLLPAASIELTAAKPTTQHTHKPLGWPHDTNLPIELTEVLRDKLDLQHFVETGTREGVTTKVMAEKFARVSTIELEPKTYDRTKAALAGFSNVNCILGDSTTQLPELLLSVEGPAMFWLDAHWSGGDTGKGASECPVLDELKTVYAHRSDHVVFIDDARLFISPPPPPHQASDWPTFAMIRQFLEHQEPTPTIHVVGDVIVAGPEKITPFVEAYCQQKGLKSSVTTKDDALAMAGSA
ncbi:MAG: FkbM family methyltransferase [Gemmataceae bacterium]